jgi:hypothetical protein
MANLSYALLDSYSLSLILYYISLFCIIIICCDFFCLKLGATAVNLVGGDQPADVYSEIAAR